MEDCLSGRTTMVESNLLKAFGFYRSLCPELSRYMMSKYVESCKDSSQYLKVKSSHVCSYCGNTFIAETCSVRLHPKMKLTQRLVKLLKHDQKFGALPLSKYRQQLLKDLKNNSNSVIIKCNVCKKRKKIFGRKRTLHLFNEKHYEDIHPKASKKKRSWKDRTAGLNLPKEVKFKLLQKSSKKKRFHQPPSIIEAAPRSWDSSSSYTALPSQLKQPSHSKTYRHKFIKKEISKKQSKLSVLQKMINQRAVTSNNNSLEQFLMSSF